MKCCPFCGCDVTVRFRMDSHTESDRNREDVTIEKVTDNGQYFCIECAECETRRIVPIEGLMELGGDEWDGSDEGLWDIMESCWDLRFSD